MAEYYRISYCEDEGGVAYALDHDDIIYLPYSGLVKDWQPLHFEIRDGGYADYLPSDICQRFCSEKLRLLFDSCKTEYDEIQWLETYIRKDEEERVYYILHFPNPPKKILDKKNTIYAARNHVVKPVLSQEHAAKHAVFTFPTNTVYMFISEEVKAAIEAAGITGIEISRVPSV